jgi:hypothetical protein
MILSANIRRPEIGVLEEREPEDPREEEQPSAAPEHGADADAVHQQAADHEGEPPPDRPCPVSTLVTSCNLSATQRARAARRVGAFRRLIEATPAPPGVPGEECAGMWRQRAVNMREMEDGGASGDVAIVGGASAPEDTVGSCQEQWQGDRDRIAIGQKWTSRLSTSWLEGLTTTIVELSGSTCSPNPRGATALSGASADVWFPPLPARRMHGTRCCSPVPCARIGPRRAEPFNVIHPVLWSLFLRAIRQPHNISPRSGS